MDRKVAAGGGTGALGVVVLWVLGEYFGVRPPAEIAVALTTCISGFIGWWVPGGPVYRSRGRLPG